VAVVDVVLVVGVETVLVRERDPEAGADVAEEAGVVDGDAVDCGVEGSGFVADRARPLTLGRAPTARGGLVKGCRANTFGPSVGGGVAVDEVGLWVLEC